MWAAFHRPDDADLSQHELELLHHVPATDPGASLSNVARHLALPKSTASVLVKDLERRGFLRRVRDPADERRLAIRLTEEGVRRVEADRVLHLGRLARALAALPTADRETLLAALDHLADLGERLGEG